MDQVFFSLYGPSVKNAGHGNKEGKEPGSVTCCSDRAKEANKMFITVQGFVDCSGKGTK